MGHHAWKRGEGLGASIYSTGIGKVRWTWMCLKGMTHHFPPGSRRKTAELTGKKHLLCLAADAHFLLYNNWLYACAILNRRNGGLCRKEGIRETARPKFPSLMDDKLFEKLSTTELSMWLEQKDFSIDIQEAFEGTATHGVAIVGRGNNLCISVRTPGWLLYYRTRDGWWGNCSSLGHLLWTGLSERCCSKIRIPVEGLQCHKGCHKRRLSTKGLEMDSYVLVTAMFSILSFCCRKTLLLLLPPIPWEKVLHFCLLSRLGTSYMLLLISMQYVWTFSHHCSVPGH